MSAASELVFPSERVVSGWWPQLAGLHPRALGCCHLFFHEIEAQVALRQNLPLDPLSHFVLRAAALHQAQSLSELQGRLDLDASLLLQVLRALASAGQVVLDASSLWSVTPAGVQSLDHGNLTRELNERRRFCFMDSQQPGRLPQFVHMERLPSGTSVNSSGNPPFDAETLRDCLRRPLEWKQKRAFPLDVTEVLTNQRGTEVSLSTWERIMIDRPRRVLSVLALTGERAEERLRAFEIHPETWTLEWRQPFFTIGPEWRNEMPELLSEPSLEEWRRALLEWCRQRRIPTVDFVACPLERENCRLVLKAPAGKMPPSRWREMFKEKPWLIAGSGSSRSLASITIPNQ